MAEYPRSAANQFGEPFAHRLRWAHAINSLQRLQWALDTNVNFIEADVTTGTIDAPPEEHRSCLDKKNTVFAKDGKDVIMGHPPFSSSSNLSFQTFIDVILKHNELIDVAAEHFRKQPRSAAAAKATAAAAGTATAKAAGTGAEIFGTPEAGIAEAGTETDDDEAEAMLMRLDGNNKSRTEPEPDEAAEFAGVLVKELDLKSRGLGGTMVSCVGSRRIQERRKGLTMKGIKLDFKVSDAVAPTIAYLKAKDVAQRVKGHLWLNADVFAGPGMFIAPLDGKAFVRNCADVLPDAVLSLSWGSTWLTSARTLTDTMVNDMLELCMTPILPELLVDGVPHNTPAAKCHHITFGVGAEHALRSQQGLNKLLDKVPGASVTIFSGSGSLSITPATVQELINTYGERRLFLDLKLSKSWRSCSRGACHVQ
eukprot:NODE_4983_length_1823_cov_18.758844.p1 GENE.NODE_4983_length_1823_cov_18.758844~~NODE_4983_length_1823_cov_18.758844.p1  ORF type:complete len:424 (+),score=92.31 NODE_4983_length_1823_cov_18.758844:202-1473(+)